MDRSTGAEAARLAALRELRVLDTPPEPVFDALVEAAALACDMPISMISLIDAERQWFKAAIGLEGTRETPREHAFCAKAIRDDELLEVPDATLDPRFADNPMVVDPPGIRFYAGAPLCLGDGSRVGTLCVLDRKPGELTPSQRTVLGHLAEAAVKLLEARRTALELGVNEAMLHETGALADIGGWELDLESGAIAWSEQTCRIHGLDPGYRPSLREAIRFYAPEARPLVLRALRGAVEQGRSWDLELPFVRSDGHRLWVRAVGRAEREEGRIVRLLGAFQNVTAQVHQRRALERAHERMVLATESGRIGVWDWHVRADTLDWTPQMYELFGLPPGPERVVPDHWLERVHPDDRPTIEDSLHDALAGHEELDAEFRVVHDDGSVHHLRIAARPTRSPDDAALRLLGTCWDVTPLRRLSDELAGQRELLHVTLQSIGDAVITTDAAGRVTWLNPEAEHLCGWSSSEAACRALPEVFEIVHGETRQPAVDPVTTCLATGLTANLADGTVLLSRGGEEYGIQDSAAPIRDADGELLGSVLVFRDVSEQRRLAGEMSYRATHDALTGMVNRSELELRLGRALTRAREEGGERALLYVDLDRFKLVNDACGHGVGDRLLQQVARLMGSVIGAGDTLARIGGDEFAVIVEEASGEAAHRLGRKLCARMDDFRFAHEGQRFRIGASIGLVPIDCRWTGAAAIMRAADAACYAAKDAGRNRVHAWFDTDQSMRERDRETRWAARIEQALDEDGFALHAQRIGPANGEPDGLHAEILVRLRDEEGRTIPPGAFLPAAERFHLVTRIDRWVLQRVIGIVGALADLSTVRTICINLSGQSVGDREFRRDAIAALERAGGEVCRRLCLEITETAAITNVGDAAAFTLQMRALGVRIALDDFGAGASSFGYLRNLSADVLKIDGRYIRNMLDDALDDAAVRCFVDVARLTGMQTVAEHVDRPELLERVRAIGIDCVQGYLLHEPEPLENVFRSAESAAA